MINSINPTPDGTPFATVPKELKAGITWVTWRYGEPGPTGKRPKIPMNPGSGCHADTTDSTTWGTFEEAARALGERAHDGIGFVLTGGAFLGVDIDHCRNPETGDLHPLAMCAVDVLASYAEASPSGTGIHIIVKAALGDRRRVINGIPGLKVEVYDTARYFTVTGNHLSQSPATIEDRQHEFDAWYDELTADHHLLERALRSPDFTALWSGDTSAHGGDHSAADLALASRLARATDGDAGWMDRLFRWSGLMRPKWDERRGQLTYGEMTIAKALEGYSPLPGVPADPATLDLLVTLPKTDTGNAEAMAHLFSDQLLYDATRKKWLRWDGAVWTVDEDGAAYRAAVATVRTRQRAIISAMDGADTARLDQLRRWLGWAIACESNYHLTAMLSVAGRLEAFATVTTLFDTGPFTAAAGGQVIDLRSGEARSALPSDRLTRRTGAAYDPSATCPRWERFVMEVFAGDEAVIRYVQRAVGYSLTGDVSEQAFFLLHGDGANGKSRFLETLRAVIGDYAGATTFGTLEAEQRGEQTNGLAALKGARFVTIIESNSDRRLNEARVKSLTGGDTITCRFLYGEWFTYAPQFKLWLATNHKPRIPDTDNGIWRRVRLIPFTQVFTGERDDKRLKDALLAELPGILNWVLDGARLWRAEGLGEPPDAIATATTAYREEQDVLGRFIEEECTTDDPEAEEPFTELYTRFGAWLRENGHQTRTSTWFGTELRRRGYEGHTVTKDKRSVRVRRGISLVPTPF